VVCATAEVLRRRLRRWAGSGDRGPPRPRRLARWAGGGERGPPNGWWPRDGTGEQAGGQRRWQSAWAVAGGSVGGGVVTAGVAALRQHRLKMNLWAPTDTG
jgi:hypothetical protein